MMQEFEKQICESMGIEKLEDDFSLEEVDSLTRAEIITLAEDLFSVSLTNADVIGLDTYLDLKKLIKERRQ